MVRPGYRLTPRRTVTSVTRGRASDGSECNRCLLRAMFKQRAGVIKHYFRKNALVVTLDWTREMWGVYLCLKSSIEYKHWKDYLDPD